LLAPGRLAIIPPPIVGVSAPVASGPRVTGIDPLAGSWASWNLRRPVHCAGAVAASGQRHQRNAADGRRPRFLGGLFCAPSV